MAQRAPPVPATVADARSSAELNATKNASPSVETSTPSCASHTPAQQRMMTKQHISVAVAEPIEQRGRIPRCR